MKSKYDKRVTLISEGAVNDDLSFQYGSNTDVYFGCGVTLKGEFWYLGGGKETSKKRQVIF